MERIEINKNLVGERIDKVLKEILRGVDINIPSRSFLRNILGKNILINGKEVKGSYKIKDGDILDIDKEGIEEVLKGIDESKKIIPEEGDLDIVYEEKDFLVINKKKGVVTHPGVGNSKGTLANNIRYYLEEKGEYDSLVDRAGIVHRLDKGVSGLMVVAKNKEAQEYFKRQFEDHLVKKIYLVKTERFKNSELDSLDIVKTFDLNDKLSERWFTAKGYVGRDSTNRLRMEFKTYEFGGSKYAVSHFLRIGDDSFLVKIDTGRMHQIRATLFYFGRYVSGDILYKPGSRAVSSDSIALESVYLKFKDMQGKEREFNIFSNEKY